jgi:hypothetical protein
MHKDSVSCIICKENYLIKHVYVCMSKKAQNLWKIEENFSVMTFQKRTSEYLAV